MRKILLTPSQVSILLSAVIILFCTLALFLSGYAIQQRTLKDLRQAIRPRPRASPKVHLPEEFQRPKIQLEDGTFIETESEVEREVREMQQVVIETTPEESEEGVQGRPGHQSGEPAQGVSPAKLQMVEALKAQAAKKSWAVENPDPLVKSRVPITRVQRRKMIKDEIQRLSQSDQVVYYQRRLW